jgi:hypothetical protein
VCGALDRRRGDGPERAPGATANSLAAFAGYVVAAVLVQAAVSGMHEPLLVAGAAGIAWAFGLVVVFTPGGLGARELAYAALLAPSFAHADLAAAAVVMRALTIAAELVILVAVGRPAAGDGPAGNRSIGEESAAAGIPDGRAEPAAHKVPSA